MFNLGNLVKQITYKSLTLAILFCLSGMMNVVCCFAKCQIVSNDFIVAQKSDTTCHKSQEELSTLTEENSSCGLTEACEDSMKDSSEEQTCQTATEQESQSDYFKNSSCKMSCCLPSDEAVDITRVPKVDSTISANSLYLVLFENISKDKFPLFLPLENLPSREKTYLKCCVFLI